MIHISLLPLKLWAGKLSLNPKGVQWLFRSLLLCLSKKFPFPSELSQNLEKGTMKIARVVVWGSYRSLTAVH